MFNDKEPIYVYDVVGSENAALCAAISTGEDGLHVSKSAWFISRSPNKKIKLKAIVMIMELYVYRTVQIAP